MQKFKTKVLSFMLALSMLIGMLQPMGALVVEAAEATNVAQGKTPTVAFVDGSEMGNLANGDAQTDMSTIAYATDGAYNNKDYHFRYAEGNGERKASYLQIDLGAAYDISAIKMWRYYDNRNYDPTVITVSDSATDWTDATVVYSSDDENIYGFGADAVTESAGYEETSEGKTIACEATGQYVRLYANGATLSDRSTNNGNHLVEFQVWGVPHETSIPDPDPTPSTSAKIEKAQIRDVAVSGTKELEGSDTLTAIYDGNPETFWTSDWVESVAKGNPYLTIELNGIYKLDKVEYTPRWNSSEKWACTGNIKKLVVEISEDGTTWTTVTPDGGADFSGLIKKDASAAKTDFPYGVEFTAQSAGFVRISATESYHWDSPQLNTSITIGDVALYGAYEKDTPVDRSELTAAIAEAENLVETEYTSTTWAVYTTALATAKDVLDDEEATQDDVDTALANLTDAYTGLVENSTNPTESVKLTVDDIRTMTASSVTEKGFQNGSTVENITSITSDELKSLVYDGHASSFWRSAIGEGHSIGVGDPYLEITLNGIYDLTKLEYTPRLAGSSNYITGNISKLYVQVSTDGTTWTTVNTDGTVVDLSATEKITAPVEFNATNIQYVRVSATESYHWNNANDSGTGNYAGDLSSSTICVADLALYGTRKGDAPVDRRELDAAIEEAEAITEGTYTDATWKALQTALAAAKAVGTDATQAEVDTAAANLKTAIEGLQTPKPLQNANAPLDLPTFDAPGKIKGETHPDMLYFENDWHGYKYFMAVTPNQNGNSQFENPYILVSNNGTDWELMPDLTAPLTGVKEEPKPYHNCDEDLVYNEATDQIYLYYNWVDDDNSNAKAEIRLFIIGYDDDKNEFYSVSGETPICAIVTDARYDALSTSIVVKDGKWEMWAVDTHDGNNFGWNTSNTRVEYRTSNDGINWSDETSLEDTFTQPGYDHWHIDVQWVPEAGKNGEYWAIYPAWPKPGGNSQRTWLFFARSTDGQVWTTYEEPILSPRGGQYWDKNFIYRSTFLYEPETDLFRVWYASGYTGNADPGAWAIGYAENDFDEMIACLGEATTTTATAPEKPQVGPIAATNFTALNNKISTSKNQYKQEDYTEASWALYAEGLALAEATAKNTNAKQAVVDALVTELTRVEALLVKENTGGEAPSGETAYIDDSEMTFSSGWETENSGSAYNSTNKYSNNPSASVTFKFTGTEFEWYGQKDANYKYGKVYIDGVYAGITDAYATGGNAGYKKLYGTFTGLENKEHTVTIYPFGPQNDYWNQIEMDYVAYRTNETAATVNALHVTEEYEAIDEVSVRLGSTKTVYAFAKNGEKYVAADITASVSDSTVATVEETNDGYVITPVAAGTTTLTFAVGNVTEEITIKVTDGSLPAKRLTISNENPLLIVPVYCQDAENDEYQWNDTLLGRWNSIPDDIKPYVVMEIHSSNAEHGKLKGFYERQLAIAEENQIPCMIVTVTAGQYSGYTATTDLDDAWLEKMIQEHECLKGFVCTENYWIYSDTVAHDVADHLKIAAQNGGWMIWYEHDESIIENAMGNSKLADALGEYGSNFAMTWKNTPAGRNANAETSAYMQGLWLAGVIEQWGGLMDTWKWYEKGFGKLFQGNISYAANSNGADEECRAVIMEPEAVLGIEMLSIYANGGTVYSFEHPAYTQGINNENSPAFDNVIYETFKYVIDNPAPSKAEILEDTKVVLHGNLSAAGKIHTGITSNDQSLPTHSTGRYGLLPAVPSSVSTAAIPSEKAVSLSTVSSMSEEQQIQYLNEKYTEGAYDGDAFAQKVDGTWILYNNNVNIDVNQNATVSVDGQSVNVAMTPHTFTMVETEKNGGISVYLNNYRVNKDEVWEGYTSSTQKWDPDVNTLLQDWLKNNYMTNTKDGEDTFRTTTYTLTGLAAAPTVSVVRGLADGYKEPVVNFSEGTATIEITCNGYVEFTIGFNEAGEEGGVTDKTELEESVKSTEGLTEVPEGGSIVFDEESKTVYEKALEEAKNVLADTNAAQEDINNANDALKEAIAGLASAKLVKDDDQDVKAEADVFIADILAADDYEDEPTVYQYKIVATDNFVVSAKKPATVKIPVAGIEEGDIVVILHKDSVKDEWVNMADAIVEVNYEEDYVLCKFENFSPVFAYVMKLADTTDAKEYLEKQISDAEKLKEENYTPETWKVLDEAIKEAKAILTDDSATKSELAEAAEAIADAIEGLKAPEANKDDNKTPDNSGSFGSKGSADKKALKKAIKKAEKLNEADYTWYSWDEIEDALEKAKEVYDDKGATQGEVDKAVALLNAAFNSLQYASKLVEVSTPAGTAPAKTGDSASIGLMVALLGISAIAIVAIIRKRKEHN